MSRQIVKDTTDVIQYIVIRDSVTGVLETGFDVTTLDFQYTRNGAAPSVKQDVTALAATDSDHADNKAIEIDATNSPGLCRVDFPDAAFATGVDSVILSVTGAGFDISPKEIELVAAKGYDGGAVWVDSTANNTNTVSGVDGIATNPVSTIAAARTIADALGLRIFKLVPDCSITLAQAFDGYTFDGYGAVVALGDQSINGSVFIGVKINGNDDASNPTRVRYIGCDIDGSTLGQFIACDCRLTGTITLAQTGTYFLDQCYSGVAGVTTPTIDFGVLGVTNLNMRHYSGGIEIENIGNTGADQMSLEGHGQLILNANCDPSNSPVIAIRGHFTITDNVSGGFVAGGGTLSDNARFAVDQLPGTSGVGAITWTYTVTSSVPPNNPIADVDVWVTSDIGGTNVIASGRTDANGVVTFFLDAGTVYVWKQKSGKNDDQGPDTEVVS